MCIRRIDTFRQRGMHWIPSKNKISEVVYSSQLLLVMLSRILPSAHLSLFPSCAHCANGFHVSLEPTCHIRVFAVKALYVQGSVYRRSCVISTQADAIHRSAGHSPRGRRSLQALEALAACQSYYDDVAIQYDSYQPGSRDVDVRWRREIIHVNWNAALLLVSAVL